MSSAQNLTEWNEQFGDIELFPERSVGGRFEFEYDKAYACRIKTAKVVKSQKTDDVQIELNVDVQGNDDEDAPSVGNARFWLDLPMQPSDLNKTKELVQKLTHRRIEDILRLLSAAAPAKFANYAEMKMERGKKVYYDFADQRMDNDAFNNRKNDVRKRTLETINELRDAEGQEVEILEGALFYVVKVKNPKSEKYPYTNYYGMKPRDIALFRSDVPF